MGNKRTNTSKSWRWIDQGYFSSFPKSSKADCSVDRVGADNPKYRQLIAAGQNATNQMTVDLSDVVYKPGNVSQYVTIGGVSRLCQWKTAGKSPTINPYYGGVTGLDLIDVNNKASIGIIKKIKSVDGYLSGPTFMGELRETIGMIRSPLKSLRTKTGLFTDLQMRILRDKQAKGKRFKPDTWSKVISDTWLEYTFGVSPLMSDIAAIAEASLNRLGSYAEVRRVAYTAHESSYNGYCSADTSPGMYAQADIYDHVVRRTTVSYSVGVKAEIHAPYGPLEAIVQGAQFNLSEIVPTAWELMPWSFLIDYFTNVGDVLNSSYGWQDKVAWGRRTQIDTCVLFSTFYYKETGPFGLFDIVPPVFIATNKRVVRTSNAPSVPEFSVSLPSLGQSLNMAALYKSLSSFKP